MNKLLITLVLAVTVAAFPASALAENSSKEERRDARKEMQQKIKEERKELQQKVKETRKEFKLDFNLFKDKKASDEAKKKRGKAAHLINAEITAISSSTITVVKDGKTYTVNTSSQTKFRRHFWGKSGSDEFFVGNKVNVWGKWTDESQTTIDASMIRNLSVMKRHGVFIGQITSLGSSSFVLKSLNRGDLTVSYGTGTKFEDRRGTAIAASDLKTGHRVRVKGLWDKTNKTLTEVSQVKDFSLPEKVKVTPAVTASPTVSLTVTPTVIVTATP